MCCDSTRTYIDRVVAVPFANGVGVTHGESGRLVRLRGMRARIQNLMDLQIAKNTMVPIASVFVREKTEKEKNVADADALICKVRLRSTCLSKGTTPVLKHRIAVAKRARRKSAASLSLDDRT